MQHNITIYNETTTHFNTVAIFALVVRPFPCMLRRARSRPNGGISQQAYHKLLGGWLEQGTLSTLRHRFGGRLVKDLRSVTPAMMEHCKSLVLSFLDIGGKSCVLQMAKMEASLSRVIAHNPLLAGDEKHEALVLSLATHCQSVWSMFRYLKKEEQMPVLQQGARRYPKTGGIRRRFGGQDWVWLRPILDEIEPEEQLASAPEASMDSDTSRMAAGSARSRECSWDAEVACDESGYPLVFAQFFKKNPEKTDPEQEAQPQASPRSTIFYASDAEEPHGITPNPKKRKKLALEARSAKKAPAAGRKAKPSSPKKQVLTEEAILQHPRLSVTSEESAKGARAEITAFIAEGEGMRRMHVRTFWLHRDGITFEDAGRALHARIKSSEMTKSQALAFSMTE